MSDSLARNKSYARDVPYAISKPYHVPKERYYDREFFELEKEHLWNRTWQMACRLQEIPRANDYVEYEICDQSILVVRQADQSIKAFFNVCPHRATQMAKGSGTLPGGQITCPFHGWRWNIDGSNSFVYGREGFAPECMVPQEIDLRECKVEVWGDSVWVNMDPDAGPLVASLQPAAGLLEGVAIGNWRVKWWQETILNANWKMAQEAFMEGWHVMRTHPQLTLGAGEATPPDSLRYGTYPNGHCSFESTTLERDFHSFDVMLASSQLLADGLDAMAIDRDMKVLESIRHKIKPGDNIRDAVAREMRAYNEGAGIPMPQGIETRPLWWSGMVYLFPNIFYLPMYGNSLAYRIRPFNDDPERCRFEVWSLTTWPESYPENRATLKGRFDKDDNANWPLIPIQDFSNIERQQKGLHVLGYQGHRLATEWEAGITNMHQELDRRLARG
jgi:phenylpropionate dioxygenase-like ring-hydroxylating dioxygenase large terminal subunit